MTFLDSNLQRTFSRFSFIVILIVSPPLFLVERFSLYSIEKILIFIVVLLLFSMFFLQFKIRQRDIDILTIGLAQIGLLIGLSLVHYIFGYGLETGYVNLALQVLVGLILFLSFALTNNLKDVAEIWVNIHMIMGFLGVIVFGLGLFSGLEPIHQFGNRPYFDFGLSFTNVFYPVGHSNIIRVAGFYDEPGSYAFALTFAIVLARVFSLPRWKETVLIISGLPSLSMAFGVIVVLWVLFTLDIRQFLYLLLFGAVGVTVLSLVLPDSVLDRLVYMTIGRFSPAGGVNSRILVGDNRTPIMVDNLKAFFDSPWIGHGINYRQNTEGLYRYSFIGNPIAPLARDGILGAFVTSLHVINMIFQISVKKLRLSGRSRWFLVLTIILTLSQRPRFILGGIGYLLFVTIAAAESEGKDTTSGIPLRDTV